MVWQANKVNQADQILYLSDPRIAYYALTLCILSPCSITVEQSFQKISPVYHAKSSYSRAKQDDINSSLPDIIAFRDINKMQWQEIGELLGITKNAAFARYKKHKLSLKQEAQKQEKAG